MQLAKSILITLFLLPVMWAYTASADFAGDAEDAFTCLEDEYSRFLTPAAPPTQTRRGVIYRFYDDKNIYILIQPSGDVYFRKGLLMRQIDTVDNVLASCTVVEPPPPPPPGGCVTVTYPQAGLSYTALRTDDAFTSEENTTIVSATDSQTHSLISMESMLGNRLVSRTEIDSVENTHVTGGLRYLDSAEATANAETFFPFSTTTSVQISTVYSPSIAFGPVGQICEGDNWASPATTITSTTTVDNFTDTTTIEDAGFTATIAAVHESVTTQAGTFDSVKIHQENNDGSYHYLWISIDFAIPLLIESYDADDTLNGQLETIAIN